MRRYLLPSFLFALTPLMLPVSAQAQNYIPSNGYNGAGVVVNMDVLNAAPPVNAIEPVMSQNLPPVAPPQPPIVLHPPQPQQMPMAAPAMMPPIAPAMPAPVEAPPQYIAPEMSQPPAPVSGRQVLGSMHDTVTDEASSLPAPAPQLPPVASVDEMSPTTSMTSSPALPSPVMGDTGAIQNPSQTPSPSTGENFEAYRLFFDPSSDVLKPSETAVLDKIAGKLNADPTLRLQVRAYANGTPDNAGVARRLSLSRAMKVRDYLTQKNIIATRLDIRALGAGSVEMGDQVGNGKAPPDRVDVIFTK
jgi:outer membrane protein OmpA-like peptidoglycan-associated protein